MEIDGGLEALLVAQAASGIFQPLDFCVEAFAQSIGNGMSQIGKDVRQPFLQHFGLFDHRFQAAMPSPVVPPLEMIPECTWIAVVK